MAKYTIGIDFGTLSGRAVLVDVSNGATISSAAYDYPHGVMDRSMPDGTVLPKDWAIQHPQDYLDVLDQTIPRLVEMSGVCKKDIIAIGVDFTSSTTLPVDKAGTPLCFLDEFRSNPHAYVKLWKHHAAQPQADRMTREALRCDEDWLPSYGGKVSCEWSVPKLWQVLEEAPEVYEAMGAWVEAGDWITWQLCGRHVQSACAAGYKSFHRKQHGFPSADYFAALDERLRNAVEEKLHGPVAPVCGKAGTLTKEMAHRLGLEPGIAVAVSMVDAHACVPAAGITKAGQMLAIIGTSTCFMAIDDCLRPVPGISGAVEDGILPGCWGYEAGQSCVGDHFAWVSDHLVPESYQQEARKREISVQQYLTELAGKQFPGEHGLMALDWWNGNRSVLMDSDLTGLLLGMTLNTRPEDIYRALIEATAYGARIIVENFRAHGIAVEEFYVTGGIGQKNAMMMQIYADVLKLPVRIVSASQGGALGSAIFAATAAGVSDGGYDTIMDAINAMAAKSETVYYPVADHAAVYERLYKIYCSLHDLFGKKESFLMHGLKAFRRQNNSSDI